MRAKKLWHDLNDVLDNNAYNFCARALRKN